MAKGDSDLKINEILASNKGNFKNKNGEYCVQVTLNEKM